MNILYFYTKKEGRKRRKERREKPHSPSTFKYSGLRKL